MGNQKLRWATRDDAEGILRLLGEYHRQEGLASYSGTRMRALLDEIFESPQRGKILVAEHHGELVGYALLVRRYSFEWAAEVAVLDEIFVQGKSRDHGIGRRMIAHCEDYAASEGLPAITLEVSHQNIAAREFYRSLGFERVEREIYKRAVQGPR